MADIKLYGSAVGDLLGGSPDWAAADIRCTLHTSVYVPDQEADEDWADVSNEVVGTGYVAGGQLLTGCALTHNSVAHTWVAEAANTVWAGVTITFRYAVVRWDATGRLIAYVDYQGDQPLVAEPLTIEWNVAGIIRLGYL